MVAYSHLEHIKKTKGLEIIGETGVQVSKNNQLNMKR